MLRVALRACRARRDRVGRRSSSQASQPQQGRLPRDPHGTMVGVSTDADRGRGGRGQGPRHRGHDAQHRAAAPLDPRRAAPAAHPRRRAHRRRRADHRLHAPRRGEALRGPRLPADHRAGQPPRLAVGVLQRARRRPGRRADARHGGAGARGVGPHPAGRAEPRAQPPDVPRLLPAGARRDHADLLRLPRARAAAARHGGDLRRPDALHVQPGRRPEGGPARRLARPGDRGGRRRTPRRRRHRPADQRQRDLPRPHPRRRRR